MPECKRVAVLISGRGSNMAALIYAAQAPDCPYEVALVASDKPDAEGLALARAEGVATANLPPARGNRAGFEIALADAIDAAGIDYIACAGYMRILGDDFVKRYAGRIINIHPSLLPAHKGLDTHAAVLAAGEKVTGATVHHVVAELDSGPILGQVRVAVQPGDTVETLAERVRIAEHQLFPRVLAELVAAEVSPEALLTKVRALALGLPAAAEKLSHGSPGFFVEGGKFFAYFSYDHHHDGVTGLLVKASGVEEQAQLIENDPDLYYRPAYLGPSGWVGIRLDGGAVDWGHIEDWLSRSWRMSAPKRLAAMFDL
ncbi:phosphoribosylglycinamide formyltransferase [Polymorphobacter arshaanensis]|uniref:Phosphoribosylglycinamide formyltransferase n=1 Tax=Glacieibacterium arshaanense TaxID=2511025 RepID=A0A4Y9ER31_9SPHN|nr:phosphoribosylglycinamide formyltransferase [Polymorphobacter arshaanensis]TFU03799.1 phosphoribosylglycinamide formyltransferase [Polymorphobacter arshaanensis]